MITSADAWVTNRSHLTARSSPRGRLSSKLYQAAASSPPPPPKGSSSRSEFSNQNDGTGGNKKNNEKKKKTTTAMTTKQPSKTSNKKTALSLKQKPSAVQKVQMSLDLTANTSEDVSQQDEVNITTRIARRSGEQSVTGNPSISASPKTLIDGESMRNQPRATDAEVPVYYRPRPYDEKLLGDLTGGRPGAVIETEEQLETKVQIEQEIQDGVREYPDFVKDYGFLTEDEEAEYDTDDPNAIDASTLGTWTIQDIRSKFAYEWNPLSGDPDPNIVEMNQENVRYVEETARDEDGVEIGYDPIFGPSNPVDTRAILGSRDSYMIDDTTRDDSMLTPQFPQGDIENDFNADIVQFRKSLEIMETFVDPFLPDIEIPRHVAKWHGYPERTHFEPKNFTNNRFTENPTNFDVLEPYRARQLAVEMARSKNAEWLPDGVSQAWHREQRRPYEQYNTLVGTLRKGECNPDLVEAIQPALQVLGSCVDLLSIENETVFRFAYYGLMKNKYGMSCWAETLIRDCGVDVTGVVFETGFRKRDPAYDGGDPWNGPIN